MPAPVPKMSTSRVTIRAKAEPTRTPSSTPGVSDGRLTLTQRALAGAARLAEPMFTNVAASEETRDVAFATLHGLYWLVVNLTERADRWSLRSTMRSGPTNRRFGFLRHLAHRLAGLPVVVALTVRTAQDRHRADLNSLLLEARPPIIRPRPLGKSAVARLVRASLGARRQHTVVPRVRGRHRRKSVPVVGVVG